VILPPAIAPSDDLAVVVQFAALGALIGTALAARRRGRDRDFDAWLLTARWTVALGVGAGVGVVTKWLGWW
jgi:4-amino-4-deoxy-L-arabinose transferase-like glycosyltransferase